MAGEWREMQWGDLATLEYGKGLRGYENGKGQYRVYGTNGPIGWHHEFLAPHATVIVGRKGAYRGIHYSPRPCFVIDTAFFLKPRMEFDMRWAYYELLTHDIDNMDSGSAIPSTSREAFYRLPVRVPPPEEQRAIAHVLGTLDDKIAFNRRMSETLEAMARAIFKAWFVDFEPVRAKMEGRWRRGESLPGLPAELYDRFPNRLVDSELGEIPEGWSVASFGDTVDNLRQQENPFDSPTVEFRHFSIPAFDNGQWPRSDRGEQIRSLKMKVLPGVILLSKLNPEIERVWLVDVNSTDRAVCSMEFLVLRPRLPYDRCFVYCLSRSPLFRKQIKGLVTGTSKSHQRAQVEAILNVPVVLPPEPLARAFERVAAPLLKWTLSGRRESHKLAVLRDALLPELLNGEIRVEGY